VVDGVDEATRLQHRDIGRRGLRGRPRAQVAAVLGVVALAALAGALVWWYVVRDDGSHVAAPAAVGLSESRLRALVSANAGPVYWAGPRSDVTYELTQTPDRRTYVRYLPSGAAVGTSTPYLTVATYPVPNAFAATRAAARSPGTVAISTGTDAVAFYTQARPTNVYMAFPGSSSQIEIFDPSADGLHRLVADGAVGALGGRSSNAAATNASAVAASPAELKALGYRAFWLGPVKGTTYELTRTPNGRVYVRYLPAGVRVGTPKAYLTVATYPVNGAFAATRTAAQRNGSVAITVPGGGIAFYARTRPASVYVAFPNGHDQIEVFDPSSTPANRFAAARRVMSVP
jgi:hypothetical protein